MNCLVSRGKSNQPGILYSILLKCRETFSDKHKLIEFVASRPALQKVKFFSLERRKIIQVRNSELNKVRKNKEEGISKGNIKLLKLLI